jgi:aquaporin Z
MEAAGLGLFMVAAAVFATLLEHPASPLRHALPDALMRRILMGAGMGLVAATVIYSPWGRRSGAHLNPAVTLAFLHLGKIRGADAVAYVVAQFLGALAGMLVARALIGPALGHPSVGFVATLPGRWGSWAAFGAELAISFVMMTVVLTAARSTRWMPLGGAVASGLVAAYIALEAPLSGMSMNPARTLGSALPARQWSSLWVYFIAPPVGMLLAAELHLRRRLTIRCPRVSPHAAGGCAFACEGSADASQ